MTESSTKWRRVYALVVTASDRGSVQMWCDDGFEMYRIKTVRLVRAEPGKQLLIKQVGKTKAGE